MMVHMLSFSSGSYACGMSSLMSGAGIFESCSFALEFLPCLGGVVVMELFLLHRRHRVTVLLWKDFLVLNGLNRGMIMVLLDLAIYGFLD
jgi:hypothetical protein